MNKVKQFTQKDIAVISEAVYHGKNTYKIFAKSWQKFLPACTVAWMKKEQKLFERAVRCTRRLSICVAGLDKREANTLFTR